MYRSASFPSLPEECEKYIDKDILTNNRPDFTTPGLSRFPNISVNNLENVPFTPQSSHVIRNGQSASSRLFSESPLPTMLTKVPQNVYMNQMPLTSSLVSGVSGLCEQDSSYPRFHVNTAGNLFLPVQSNQMIGSGQHTSSRPFPEPEVPPPGITASYFPNPPYSSLTETTSIRESNPWQSLHPTSECQTSARNEHFSERSVRDQILPTCEQQNQQSLYHQTTLLAGVEPQNASENQRFSLIGERQDARMQIPQPTLTHLNPTVQSEIQGIRSIPQRFPLLPPEISQRSSQPPTVDCFRFPGQQLTPTLPVGPYYDPTLLQSTTFDAYRRSQLPPPPPPHWYTRPPVPPPYTLYGQQQNSLDYFQGFPVVCANIGAQPVIYPTPYSSMGTAPVNTTDQHQDKDPELADDSTKTNRNRRNVAKKRATYQDKETRSRRFRRSPGKEDVADTEDTSDSSTGTDEKAAPQPQTIKIRGVMDSKMTAICKYYFQNPEKGGGEIEEFEWDNIEHIFYIKFADAKVAKRVSSSVHKIGDRQLEISLAPGGIPESVGVRTVEISGGDVEFLEIYRQYFENPVNGGGAISKIWAEEQQLFITFKDAAVAETVCCKSHTVEEHRLVAKLANMEQGTDPKRDLEQLNEEWTTVECTVGPQLRDEVFYREYFEAVESGGLVEDIFINTEDGKVLVTFDSGEVARQVASGRHRIDGKDVQVDLMKTSPFYQNKLLFRNVARNVHKELLMIYMESISGQDGIELIYSDVPGDVVVTFQCKIDFSKIREKCQTKPLIGVKLQVHRVPVSKCVLVGNLNPNTSNDDLAHYFETLGGGGVGAVLKVLLGKDNTKYIFLKDPEAAQGVATKRHLLGGRELVVRLYLKCLGPSGGKEDPYVFILPEPLELNENTNIKVYYLQHHSGILQTFNESLSNVHAHAKIVENVLKVECTLNESEPNVHLLVDSWKDGVQKQLDTCFDLVRLDRQEVLPEIWPDVIKAAEKCEICGDDLLLPLPKEHAFLILSIKNKEGGTFEKIQSFVKDVEKEVTLKKLEVRETKQLKKHERDLLMLSSFFSDVHNHHERLTVNIHEQESTITFCGQLVDIRDAQRAMLETIRSASSTIVKDMPTSKMRLLANENSHELIRKKLKSSELAATWDCHNEGVVTVFCLKESDLHRAVEVIQTSFREETLLLDEISSGITELARWVRLKNDLMQYHKGILTISTNPNTITITTISDIMPDVRETVEDFIAENSVYSAVFSFSPSRQKYLATFWEERLADITEKWLVYKVQIALDDQKRNIIVKGTKEGIQIATKDLATLEKKIVCTEEKITRKEIIECLIGLKNMNELKVTAKAYQCVLSLNPEENGIQFVSTNQPVSPEKQTMDRHLVSAMVADITKLAVDAIVNAANDRMAHGGGVAGAIVSKGGKEIQDECYRLLKTRGKLSEGDVLVSGPGKLPCKSIIHAVGPVYKGGKCGEKERLQTAVQNCLKTASDHGYTSIALPAISSGIFGYPVDKATRDIVEAVRHFFRTNPDSSIRDVNLCDVLQDTVDLFHEALGQNSFQGNSTHIVHDSPFPLHRETTASTVTFRKLLTVSQEIKMSVVEGEIAKQHVDVIVNSTSQDLNLSAGAISSSILKAAGSKLQKECSIKYPKGIPSGDIACTQSFNLECKAVFHIALCKWGDGASAQLESVVEKCLQEASRRQFLSMAIPALGTGVLGFPREETARSMFSTINRFQQTSPNTSLKEVRVVVFNDPATLKAFRLVDSSTMKQLQVVNEIEACAASSFQDVISFKAEEEMEQLKNSRLEPNVFLPSLVFPKGASLVSEPESSDSNVSVSLGGLHVTIKQGDITEEHVDAIVNSSNAKLDLTRGAVSTILKAKCGDALEAECRNKLADIAQHTTVVTAAHNLKCKHIVHLDAMFYHSLGDWGKAYTAVLQEAEKTGLRSLAVPALGTGTLGLSPSDSAQALAKAIVTHKQTGMTLQRVAVVLYDSATVRAFTEVLRREEKPDTVQTLSSKDNDLRKKSLVQRAIEKLGCIFKPKRDSVPDVLTLYIFAASRTKTEEFRKYLYEFVDGKYENKEVNDLEKLSSEELEEIEEVCKSLKVEVQRNSMGAVVLKGMKEDVEKSREMIRVFIKETERQHQAAVMANVVQWYYFQEKSSGTERKAFRIIENLLIEEAFQTFQKDQNKDSVEISLEDDDTFVVNFTERKKYSKLNPSDGVRIIRKEIIKDGVSSVSLLPEEWELHEEEEEDAVKLVDLQNGCDEYKTVHDNFSRTANGKFSILSIQRIQNSVLYKQYMAKKAQMDKQNKGMESEKTLWHGTSSDTIQNINRYGFDRSYRGKNATCYGQGVYFAVNSSYSMNHTYSTADSLGQKYIYQCKVLVGHSTLGSENTKTLPMRQGAIKYDSATNNESNPEMYVIFHDSQAYPEYLVTFKQYHVLRKV